MQIPILSLTKVTACKSDHWSGDLMGDEHPSECWLERRRALYRGNGPLGLNVLSLAS